MKKGYTLIPILLFISAGLAYTVLRNNAHEFSDGQCPGCHAVTPVKGKRETLKMKAPIQHLCGKCHGELEGTVSHPVEIAPVNAVLPADLPLSVEGKMTCSTCHDIHAAPPPGFTLKWSFLRRQDAGQAFCSACHAGEDSGLMKKENSHSQAIGRAHMEFTTTDEKGGRIDNISRTCLSCHDGSLGLNADVAAGAWEHGVALSKFDPQGSHPIGVNYKTARRKRGGLHPIGTLNPLIKLIGGKVGCCSCHDPYSHSQEPKMLVMSNSGSRLCLACHDK